MAVGGGGIVELRNYLRVVLCAVCDRCFPTHFAVPRVVAM